MMFWALIAGWYLEKGNPPRDSWRRWIAEKIVALEGLSFKVALGGLNFIDCCSSDPSSSEED